MSDVTNDLRETGCSSGSKREKDLNACEHLFADEASWRRLDQEYQDAVSSRAICGRDHQGGGVATENARAPLVPVQRLDICSGRIGGSGVERIQHDARGQRPRLTAHQSRSGLGIAAGSTKQRRCLSARSRSPRIHGCAIGAGCVLSHISVSGIVHPAPQPASPIRRDLSDLSESPAYQPTADRGTGIAG